MRPPVSCLLCVFGVVSAAERPPSLPGPGLELPVDADGDGVSTYGDRYAFNHWLELRGSLGQALLGAELANGVIDLSRFLSSPEAALSPESPLLARRSGGSSGPRGGAPSGSHVDFTRRMPPDVVPDQASRQVRATPDGAFMVFSSAADLGFGSNAKFQVYRVAVSARDVSTIELASVDTQGVMATENREHPSVSDDGQVVAFHTRAQLDPALDQNSHLDVYVRHSRGAQPGTRLVSVAAATGDAADDASWFASVSGQGNVVVFTSRASDLILDDPGEGAA